MIQVQILVGDLHKGHLDSDDVIRGHQQVFANNSRIKRATDTGMVSLCSSCRDVSPDMQHDLPGSICYLTWSWPEVRFRPNPLMSPGTCFDAAWRVEHDVAWIRTPVSAWVKGVFNFFTFISFFLIPIPHTASLVPHTASLVQKLFPKTWFQKKIFWHFMTPSG